MPRFLNLLGLIFASITVAFAAPAPQDHASQPQAEQLYYLRTYAPNAALHDRWLVTLPTSQRVGLENFTIHPPTTPLKFRPVHLTNGTYALRGESSGDDLSEIPYLAALNSQTGTRTVGMAIVYIPSPTRDSFNANPEACPEGFECIADQWQLDDAGKDGVYLDFRFGGFKGKWEPFKDAAPEGWHVYWKGNAGLLNPVRFDLVPFSGDEKGVSDVDEVDSDDD